MIALADVLDLDLGSNLETVRDVVAANGLGSPLATRIVRALVRAGIGTLRDAEDRLARGDRIVCPRYVAGFRANGLGVRGELALREVLGLPAEPPARRIVLTLVDGSYVDEADIEWIRAEELDEELVS